VFEGSGAVIGFGATVLVALCEHKGSEFMEIGVEDLFCFHGWTCWKS